MNTAPDDNSVHHLMSKPVKIFVTSTKTPSCFEDVDQFNGELIGFDKSGALLRAGAGAYLKFSFFPRERILRIESA